MDSIVSAEDLKKIQEYNTKLFKLKISLADLEMRKIDVIAEIDALKQSSISHEEELVAKYGDDAVININTGQITRKK